MADPQVAADGVRSGLSSLIHGCLLEGRPSGEACETAAAWVFSLTTSDDTTMRDELCVDFLQWALPRLGKRWPGFRKVRGQVCKRIMRRMQELELRSTEDYRAYLEANPDEWEVLDRFCRITISRFYRDRGVFDALRYELLPELAARVRQRSGRALRAWSAGCASGEEPYTLRLIWDLDVQRAFPEVDFRITATDAEVHMLRRARRGQYPAGTLKELPDEWIETAFDDVGGEEPYCLRPAFRNGIAWHQQDIREVMPAETFDLVCCRNLVFTYFDEALQRSCLERIHRRLRPGGLLILGKHETLPDDAPGFAAWDKHKRIYRKRAGGEQ